MNSENINTIYTIGHSNKPFSEILKILKNYKISLLVDVRSYPYSKYVPQFDQERLSSALMNSDIIYWYAGDNLGGRPKDPSCYRGGKIPEGKANYLELVDYREMAKRSWFKEEITKIVARSNIHRIAIMCSEEDPQRCHRHHLIARTLSEMGITVWHIRGGGNLEEAKFDIDSEYSLHERRCEQQKTLFDFS